MVAPSTERWTVRARALLLVAFASIVPSGPAAAEEGIEWPLEIETKKGMVTIYQPQLDTFEGNSFTARAAVSVTPKDKEPVFGVAWFNATCETDRREREVHLEKVEVPRVRFPDATPEQEKTLSEFLAKEMSTWDITLSLDALLATLEEAEGKRATSDSLGTTPPKILFLDHLAMLVTFDGEPKLGPIPDSKMQYVVNSPQPIVFDPESKVYYLSVDEHFMAAKDPLDEWKVAKRIPKEVEKLAEKREEAAPEEAKKKEDEDVPPPEIIVAQEPTELIVTDGKPEFATIAGSELLYMTNTDSDVFLEVATGQHFLPLAGRWYRSKSLEGPWEHVEGDSLPAAFAQIPPDSDKGHVLAFVPGTDAAIEAALDAQVPQTAAVKRKGTVPEVKYDGDPEFKDIEGTQMAYAVNTSSAVLRIEGKFWCCDNAVWFVADDPKGPWQVSDVRPDAVDDLPPDNPHYNVKYVYVYDSTPEVVYVGYTPGYTGCYVYGGCVVYGTGYPYPGGWGPYYYPHPVTYGVHISYNPWSGWGFGFGCATSHFSFHVHSGGFYGPPYYRPPYYRPPGYRPPGYRPPGYRPPAYRPPGNRPGGARPTPYASAGVYDRRAQTGQAQVRDRSSRPGGAQGRPTPTTSPARNDVYADRNGDVYRKDQGGDWQKREGNQWKNSDVPKDRAQTRTQPSNPSSRQQSQARLERDSQARQRSADRSRSMGGSRSRGGGGRRR
jgi:hypothetical protein